jgi:hypothetical protein
MPRGSMSHGTKWTRKIRVGTARAISMESIGCEFGGTLWNRMEVYVGCHWGLTRTTELLDPRFQADLENQ